MCYPGIHECQTVALTKKQQNRRRSRFAKNNLVRIIVGIKRKMDEMGVDDEVKENVKNKLVKSTWAGHVENNWR